MENYSLKLFYYFISNLIGRNIRKDYIDYLFDDLG